MVLSWLAAFSSSITEPSTIVSWSASPWSTKNGHSILARFSLMCSMASCMAIAHLAFKPPFHAKGSLVKMATLKQKKKTQTHTNVREKQAVLILNHAVIFWVGYKRKLDFIHSQADQTLTELYDNSADVPFNERRYFAILKAETNFCGSRRQKISAWTKFFAVLSSGTKTSYYWQKRCFSITQRGFFCLFFG